MKSRKQVIKDILQKYFFVSGFNKNGKAVEAWCVMDQKLYNTIHSKEKKLNKTINKPIRLGDLVVHSEHPIGIGLVVERHQEHKAYRVEWINQPTLNLFIAENCLVAVKHKEVHARE